jgi:hypothetical protein
MLLRLVHIFRLAHATRLIECKLLAAATIRVSRVRLQAGHTTGSVVILHRLPTKFLFFGHLVS